MQTVDTIIHARWIVPVIPRKQIYTNYAIIINDGRITDILGSEIANKTYISTQIHHLDEHCLIPGLINAHTHSPMNLMRGLADDLHLMEWLEKHIWPAEARHVSAEFVRHGSELAMAEMLRSGTTCFNDMYFYPEQTAQLAEKIGIRAVVGQIIIDFPSAWAKDANEYFFKGEKLYEQIQENSLVTSCMAPHAPYTVNNENLLRVKQSAEKMQIPIHIHLHETDDEIQSSLKNYQQKPIARLASLGLLSEQLIAVHMTHLDESDVELILRENVNIVHCPESNMKLASHISPVSQLLRQGLNIALGTDSVASNNDLDMLGEMKSATLLAKVSSNDATALSAETVLEMATINGARSLGLENQCGSLEVGKSADLCAIRMDELECNPLYHPVSQIIYTAHREQVSDVWVQGKQLLKQRQLLTIDINQILNYAKFWQQKLQPLK